MTVSSEVATPVTPVRMGSAAAQPERKTSSRMTRAARMPMASVPWDGAGFSANACPPTPISSP